VENVGGVWKEIGHLKTVIVQFEYEIANNIYGEYRSESRIQYTLDACKESMEIYAEEHGYDFKYITETAPFHEEHWKDYNPYGKVHIENGGATSLGQNVFGGTGWKYVYGWFYYLPELASKYDRIIKTDTDVYVVNPKVPFPIEKTGFVTKCLNNLGVIMFDKKTANDFFKWGTSPYEFVYEGNNLFYKSPFVYEEGYWDLMKKFLKAFPEYENCTLPTEFHNTIMRSPELETCVMFHLSSMPNDRKYDGLCTALKKYT